LSWVWFFFVTVCQTLESALQYRRILLLLLLLLLLVLVVVVVLVLVLVLVVVVVISFMQDELDMSLTVHRR